jgi:hypothetical protein
MIKIDSLSLKLMRPEKIELLEKLQLYLEKKDINVVRLSPWANRIEIFISSYGQKRQIVEVQGYEHYTKIGEESYFKYIDQEIENKLSALLIKKKEIEEKHNLESSLFLTYVYSNDYLKSLNAYRSRNFILYRNESMDLVYDIRDKELFFDSKDPFSDIEYDTNRKFTEKVCIDTLLDFESNKKKYIKLLSKPYDREYIPMYQKYIDIINGDFKSYTEDDVLVMISILGRLSQQQEMGPITVRVDDKLNPNKVMLHDTIKKYIYSCLVTIKEYTQLYLSNKE